MYYISPHIQFSNINFFYFALEKLHQKRNY